MSDNACPPFVFHAGTQPLLLSIPHMGTHIPPAIAEGMTSEALEMHDTDWHLDQLYSFAREMDISVLMATHSRYVVDLNRPQDGASLYPGQNVTGLCPVDTFDQTPLYLEGSAPDPTEVQRRVAAYWKPYHEQLSGELRRLRNLHGNAVLWDAHSIRSVVPRFFEGRLPNFNLGTADGTSCSPDLAQALMAIAKAIPDQTAVLNGRFKGGHITRQYGEPEDGMHAVQLELTQSSYMQEAMPFAFLPERAALVQPHLKKLLQACLAFSCQAG
ncbi:N-formylglutamate deformylase [Hydrogenophaga crassostreae]|uniref:N-formylglutamate deformylase n=1 Tax=Hydrogenophaga crassostreae TaxID=1763535 RepID=A0A167HXC7_9BURK|nr:N-formylglutamate deformylase [Hydrogenophaga crassostreae]AOW13566.1 N-formylglutamate deformylase [Hydrogenophaga crassostreae]OAD41859.1 N-formylglutamate deformylase [Hydrogenophaga crassostreae]